MGFESPGSEPGSTALRAVAKDIAFGSIAGMVSEVFEYPFDLAKVRLQAQLLDPSAQARFAGPVDCLQQTWRTEGIRGLYRGLPVPVVGSMAETASLFVAYTALQNLIRAVAPSPTPGPLPMAQLALAAAGAGFATSFILTPIELVKCRMQVSMVHTHAPAACALPNASSPLSITRTPRAAPAPPAPSSITAIVRGILRTEGVRGLWLGHTGTILRETAGSAAWFVCKEALAGWLRRRRAAADARTRSVFRPPLGVPAAAAVADTDLLPWESALSGAVAGGVCVLALYPADTVKSAVQTQDGRAAPFLGTLRYIFRRYGIRGLYAGCGMTVLRAVPSSGIVFVVYDGLCQWVG